MDYIYYSPSVYLIISGDRNKEFPGYAGYGRRAGIYGFALIP